MPGDLRAVGLGCQAPLSEPYDPLPGILSLQVIHGTSLPLSPQGTLSRYVTLLAALDSVPEWSSHIAHPPTERTSPLPCPFTHFLCPSLVHASDLVGVP